MKKEILTPGNIVLGNSKVIRLLELRSQEAIDDEGVSWPYEKLDGILITYDDLIKDGYTSRTITTPLGGTKNDLVKQITLSDSVFYTVSISNVVPGVWRLEIQNSNHQQVCSCEVTFWHNLQNFISAYVLS